MVSTLYLCAELSVITPMVTFIQEIANSMGDISLTTIETHFKLGLKFV